MNCHEARELSSALLDDALDADERSAVEAHLAGCAECRREVDRLRQTVALLRGAAPARAPAGFVDRVLAAAAPEPWYRRLSRRLLSPLGAGLPLGAAAVLTVAGIAVYVYQHTPELQQAARQEAPPPAPPPTPPAGPAPPPSVSIPPGAARVSPPSGASPSQPTNERSAAPPASPSPDARAFATPPQPLSAQPPASAPPAVPREPSAPPDRPRAEADRGAGGRAESKPDQASGPGASTRADETGAGKAVGTPREPENRVTELRAKEAARKRAEETGNAASPGRAPESAAAEPRDRLLPSALTDQPTTQRQAGVAAREETAGSPVAPAAPPQPLLKSAPAPAAPPGGAGDGRLQARPQVSQDAAAKAKPSASAGVAAQLAVPDREAAFRALADVLARAGGHEVSRRVDGDADAVEIAVPREHYAELLRSLAQLGRLSLEGEPAALPGEVRINLRILHAGG